VTLSLACPVCGRESWSFAPALNWGEWRRCTSCELEFVEPMRLTEAPETLYDGAYRGIRKQNAMEEFSLRVSQRRTIITEPSLWFWTPAFKTVLDWLQHRLPAGATVLEVGCGLGFLLHELRNRGFQASGLDVAEAAVELNRNDGFEVWHGTVKSLPANWLTQADAVLAFFMLHHLEDPIGLLTEIKSRWPNAPVAIAQYGPSNRDPERSAPPRTLTRWGAKSLEAACARAGYRSTVMSFPSSGAEHPAFKPLTALFRHTTRFPRIFRFARRVQRKVLPNVVPTLRVDDYVVLALAEPN